MSVIIYIIIGILFVVAFGLFAFKIIAFIKGVGNDSQKDNKDK